MCKTCLYVWTAIAAIAIVMIAVNIHRADQ